MHSKNDWASHIVGRKFTVCALFSFVKLRAISKYRPPRAHIWRGSLTEVFIALQVWGTYIWRDLFSEFYGSSSLNSCECHLFQFTITQEASFPGKYTIDQPGILLASFKYGIGANQKLLTILNK